MASALTDMQERVPNPRLLVLSSTYPRWRDDPEPGFVHELSRRLGDRFDVVVIAPHAAGALAEERLDGVLVRRFRYAPQRLELLVNDGGIVTNLRRRPWLWMLVPSFMAGLAGALLRELVSFRPDVIHAHWLIPQGAVLAVVATFGMRLPPFVVTSHGADLFALRGRSARRLQQRVLSRAQHVTVVSQALKEEAVALGASPSNVSVEPMGVDLEGRFTVAPQVQRSSNEILFVGRLVEKKGLRHLLDALPLILRVRPDVRLTVAGFGPELAASTAQARALGIEGSVEFVGAVKQSDLAALYRRAAVFAAPFVQAASGDQEGLGLVLVEALGCGCPVVVSDLPATAELPEGGAALRRVPPGDPAALAEALVAVLRHPPRDVPDVSRFAWAQRAEAYSRVLLRACGR